MKQRLAIDFGTTNSVVAEWNDQAEAARILALAGLSNVTDELPALIPSLVYVADGRAGKITSGQAVREMRLDYEQDNRLFRNFKRGLVAAPAPDARLIDGEAWGDMEAGSRFMRELLKAIPYPMDQVEQLVLTAPVASFEGYLTWLNELITDIPQERVRLVDESTAAALGYLVTEPGAVVLVFDFGGGTLDLSLVQLPESKATTGRFLGRLLGGKTGQHSAKVIAKAGRVIGGSDIDQWLLAEVLRRSGLNSSTLGADYAGLLTVCEQAKIALSTQEAVTLRFTAGGQERTQEWTRAELEALLETHGFYTALRQVVDKVLHVAQRKGVFREDIHAVLLVGGISLMPSVQETLRQNFNAAAVRADKPFTAVVEGALQVAAGYGLEDYLVHSYGIRHLDAATQTHLYDEIIPMGSRYPLRQPVEVLLGAAHEGQTAMEFVIGEIDTEAVGMLEVQYEGGQAVFVAQAERSEQQIIPLNEEAAAKRLAALIPAGVVGEDRVKAVFNVDAQRQLRLTVTDLKTRKVLIDQVTIARLR